MDWDLILKAGFTESKLKQDFEGHYFNILAKEKKKRELAKFQLGLTSASISILCCCFVLVSFLSQFTLQL